MASASSLLDAELFSASSTRDALGRILTAVSPDGNWATGAGVGLAVVGVIPGVGATKHLRKLDH